MSLHLLNLSFFIGTWESGMVDVNAKIKWRWEGNARGNFYGGPESGCSELKQDSVPRIRIIHQKICLRSTYVYDYGVGKFNRE